MQLRLARISDRSFIAELLEEGIAEGVFSPLLVVTSRFVSILIQQSVLTLAGNKHYRHATYVATIDGKRVGFATVLLPTQQAAILAFFAIASCYRYQRLGGKLLQSLLDETLKSHTSLVITTPSSATIMNRLLKNSNFIRRTVSLRSTIWEIDSSSALIRTVVPDIPALFFSISPITEAVQVSASLLAAADCHAKPSRLENQEGCSVPQHGTYRAMLESGVVGLSSLDSVPLSPDWLAQEPIFPVIPRILSKKRLSRRRRLVS